MNPRLSALLTKIQNRSQKTRTAYLDNLEKRKHTFPQRELLSPSNLAHACAGEEKKQKIWLSMKHKPNIGIITAYNDILSAHKPFATYPNIIKNEAEKLEATAQVAGGVPAMCDGITQGQDGMELSLYSRDVIALATSIALSHNAFDSIITLGTCDKIIPGLLIGALNYGHLPCIFLSAGPMTSGVSNLAKSKAREAYIQGHITEEEMLNIEMQSYHSQGTCTFYGTANTNQILLEAMGLQVPASAFVNTNTLLRQAIISETTYFSVNNINQPQKALGKLISEKNLINAIVALLATGGSTNHTIHLIAIARAAGILLTWDDFQELADITPLLVRLYPNGQADVNGFTQAGGSPWVLQELLDAGLLFEEIETVAGSNLRAYTRTPVLEKQQLLYQDTPRISANTDILRPVSHPFAPKGGIKIVKGNLGEAIVKISAVPADKQSICAPAKVFSSQQAFLNAFEQNLLQEDFIAVLPYQGPSANGMPELHKLTPALTILQNQGYKVALLTDGRMSGASGNVLAAIHVVPEAIKGGLIGKIQDGDLISIDTSIGQLTILEPVDTLSKRTISEIERPNFMRQYFQKISQMISPANEGGSFLFPNENK